MQAFTASRLQSLKRGVSVSDLMPLVNLPPDALAGHLAAMPPAEMQDWIDDVFDVAEERDNDNAASLFNLAYAANDIALLLKHGAKPSAIRRSPFRGIVSDWRASDEWQEPDPNRRSASADFPPDSIDAGMASLREMTAEDATAPESPKYYADDVVLTCGADIRPEPVDWAWPGFLAKGKLHILAGAPGCGKTTLALALAAVYTAGDRWPDGSAIHRAGSVAIWSAEDDPADTLAPRLLASGADMSRVFFVSGTVSAEGEHRSFDPATDTGHLSRALAGRDVGLLIVDPVVSAVAGDSHKNADTRRALQPLVDLASRLGCAVLGISHFSKGTQGRDPVERVTGSIAFGALARLVFACAKVEEGEAVDGCDRLFVRSKSNIGMDGGGWRYALEQVAVPGHPLLFASRVRWGAALEGEARALLATAETATDPEEKNALADAVNFLRDLLTDGPLPAKTIRSDGENAGHTWRTLHRAADKLNVDRRKEGMRSGWAWHLPLTPAAKMPTDPRRCHEDAEQKTLAPSQSLAPSGENPPL